MKIMVGFIIGLFVGGFFGVLAMCLCVTAKDSDERENCTGKDD
jgi:Na+/H+ antiporter NhaC